MLDYCAGSDYLEDHDDYIHPAILESYKNAMENGSPLLGIMKSRKYYKETWKYIKDKYKPIHKHPILKHLDFDELYYSSHIMLGWGLPSKDWTDVIRKTFKGDRILEIGCGSGLVSKILSHHFDVVATDIDPTWGSRNIDYIGNREILDCVSAICKYYNSYIVSVYPYIHMQQLILAHMYTGQRIFLYISPLAGIATTIISYIRKHFKVLSYVRSFTTDILTGQPNKFIKYGVVLEKISQGPIDYHAFHKRIKVYEFNKSRKTPFEYNSYVGWDTLINEYE